MAAGCVFHRTLVRSQSRPEPGPNQASAVCREQLVVFAVDRYTRDQSSILCFPQNVLHGSDLYDLTLFDGDCLLRVSLDPSLNDLVEKHILRSGVVVKSATFRSCLALQLPESSAAQDPAHHTDSFSLVSLEVCGHEGAPEPGPRSWFGSGPSYCGDVEVLPLRAKRSVFLSVWNNSDPHGDTWRRDEEEEEEEDLVVSGFLPSVSVENLRQKFLSSVRGGTVQKQLIVRVSQKSSLMFYGRMETNAACPYKVLSLTPLNCSAPRTL